MKFLLLDASIIIEAYKLKIWRTLTGHYKISVVSSVASEASFVPNMISHRKNYIDLKTDIITKKITKISIPTSEIITIIKKAKNKMTEEIHRGEAESIAALLIPQYSEFFFCTSDKPAVLVAHLCKVMDKIVSFENCLIKAGANKKVLSKIPAHYTEKVMRIIWKPEAIRRFRI